MGSSSFIPCVFPQLQEILDVQMPGFKIGACRTTSFSAPVYCSGYIIRNFQEWDYPLAFNICAFYPAACCPDVCPVIAKASRPFRKLCVIPHTFENMFEVIFHGCEIA